MTEYYLTDPTDPDAPVKLDSYGDLSPGVFVVYENPHMRRADGTYHTAGMDGPLVVMALYRMVGLEERHNETCVTAILNDGEWEVNADNLRAVG